MPRPVHKLLSDIPTVPFSGGAITVREPALLPFGAFSMVQNMNNKHPGMEMRAGCRKLHTTADGTNQVMSLYQFNKSEVNESHQYAQMSDGDVLVATADPPGVTTGAFGAEAHSGTSSGMIPASWSNIRDLLLYSNGTDQHQIYGGSSSYVDKFIVCKMTAAIPDTPDSGEDYSYKVRNTDTAQVGVLDALSTYANHDCLFIKTAVPCKSFTFTMNKTNDNASTMTLYYWKTDHTWANVAITDGTDDSGDTLKTSPGTVTFTAPTDMMPKYMYGTCGFWYQFRFSAALDAEVEVTSVTYDSDWQDIQNVWDGVPQNAVEVYVEGTTQWETYGPGAVTLSELAAGKKVVVMSAEPIEGIYIDVQGTPNTTGISLSSCKYWDGAAFTTVGTAVDGGSGMANSGWITFPRCTAHPTQFETSMYYAYAYELIWDTELAADMVVQVQVMPYFSVTEAGNGYTNCAWKDMMLYTFDQYGEYVYVSAPGAPLVLNGSQYGILVAGDGRANKIKAMRRFHNEVMVWQEEKGAEGGCLTLFEGYSPETFGKLILSTRIGIMNNKCAEVIDGVLTSTQTNEQIKTLAFWISRYGYCASDGRTVSIISDDIQNYFDPVDEMCIRRGYEDQHWMGYDSARNSLISGLVSSYPLCTGTATSATSDKLVNTAGAFTTRKQPTGYPIVGTVCVGDTVHNTTDDTTALITAIDSATTLSLDTDIMASGEAYEILSGVPNVFPVFDLTSKTWSFDVRGQSFACMAEAGAQSGELPVVQLGGGTADGFVYQLNYGTADVSTAIDAYVTMEFPGRGEYMSLDDLLVRCKVQASGDITGTLYENSVSQSTLTLSMTAENTNQTIRRHKRRLGQVGQHISLKLQQAVINVSMYLEDIGVRISTWRNR